MNNFHSTIVLCVFLAGSLSSGAGQDVDRSNPDEFVRSSILFAIADAPSWTQFSASGCDWVKTPAFDRVAVEGLLCNNADVPNAKCSPWCICILTGRNSWQSEEAGNHVPYFPKFVTYAEGLDSSFKTEPREEALVWVFRA